MGDITSPECTSTVTDIAHLAAVDRGRKGSSPSSPVCIAPRLEYAWDRLYCVLHQSCAIGLQTDCMMVVPAPMVRLPDSHVSALWP